MQFIVPDRGRLPEGAIDLAYLANHEESPYRTRASWRGDWLSVERDEAESGALTIPWIAGDRAPIALATGTLIERPRPYSLPVELARGTIGRLKNYCFLWPALGLVLPDELSPLVEEAVKQLAVAAMAQDQPAAAADHAERAIDTALRASAILCAAYGEQSAAARKRSKLPGPILVGTTIDRWSPDEATGRLLLAACNALAVPFDWREVEATERIQNWQLSDSQLAWCQAHDLHIVGGPLLRLDALPEWTRQKGSFDALEVSVSRHLHAVVERYRGRVHVWNCAANINTGKDVALGEEQRFRLAVRTIETVRAADPSTPILFTFDQPWGEYLRDERLQLSPIHFADALVRGELGVSAFGLRMNIGLSGSGTLQRDVLEFSRQIDRWSIFNIPLLIELTLQPSQLDAQSTELLWIDQVVPVLLGKPAVQAIFWGQCIDSPGDLFTDRGLFDAEGRPKPALQAYSTIRQRFEVERTD